MTEQMAKRLENDFVYHAPKNDQAARYEKIRAAAKAFAAVIVELTPASREQSVALTNIESAMFYGNAAIARNE